MKYLGQIIDNKDILTKEYLENDYSVYVVSSDPPSNTNKIWIKNGVPYYFDSTDSSWNTLRFVTDSNKIIITNEADSTSNSNDD